MPLVSVVIPCYNAGDFLREAVDSVLEQTFTDWECIVVDDGSTEPLPAVEGPGVRVIRQANAGVSAARNAGIRASSGALVAFLDADDLRLPEKLERQVAALSPEVGLLSCGFRFTDGRPAWGSTATSHHDLLAGNGIHTCTVLVRREALGDGFDEKLDCGEDWDLWLRVARTWPITAIPDDLVLYRTHGNQSSGDYRRMWRGSIRVLTKHRSTRGVRRMGQIYGSQAFDAFRSTRRPSHLLWASALWPGFVARSVAEHLLKRTRRARA